MFLHVVADSPARLKLARAILELRYSVISELLGEPEAPADDTLAVVVRADLRSPETIAMLRQRLNQLSDVRKRIFLLETRSHLSKSQAYALGATLVVPASLEPLRLHETIINHIGGAWDSSIGAQHPAMAEGARTIASGFAAVANGSPVDVQGTKLAGEQIAAHVAEFGLSDWLSQVRLHHEGTYQHCLLVAGVAADFGLSLGFTAADLERIYSGAMFHDLGKAKIPLAVLDKPGRLTAEERALIETHPEAGYQALLHEPGVSDEILDMVRHHHEYLDGSGYPDGLSAESISDAVRLLTISDIFSALIEYRYYKPTMSRDQAYNVLWELQKQGKIEKALLVAFKEVAMNR